MAKIMHYKLNIHLESTKVSYFQRKFKVIDFQENKSLWRTVVKLQDQL